MPVSNIGAMGIAPNSTVGFFPLVDLESLDDGTGGRAETAWFNAMEWLRFGDVISAGYIGLDAGSDFPNHTFNPALHSLIQTATNLGIQTVIGAGDGGVDLDGTAFPNDIDPGAISMCATTPGSLAKRWADSVQASNFVAGAIDVGKNTAATWGFAVTTTGMGPAQDNWLGYKTNVYNNNLNPQEVQGRSYTNNFNGTAAAASIGAGLVTSMQGYARQVFGHPVAPEFLRQYAAHGQMLGVDPDTGQPIFQNIDSAGTGNNVAIATDNNMTTTPWPNGTATAGFDINSDGVAAGAGNIIGYALDARYACIRMNVDPIFDAPNLDNAMFIRGDMFEGTAGSTNPISTLDGIFFAAVSEATPIGFYDNENVGTVPGSGVQYNFNGETTDFYFSGIATDPRGNPALDLNNITVEVDLAPTQAPTTMLQLWMWDWDQSKWVQPSVTGALVGGTVEHNFRLVRPSSLLNANGRYHARIVSITGNGPTSRFPIYYDQIRFVPTIPTTQP